MKRLLIAETVMVCLVSILYFPLHHWWLSYGRAREVAFAAVMLCIFVSLLDTLEQKDVAGFHNAFSIFGPAIVAVGAVVMTMIITDAASAIFYTLIFSCIAGSIISWFLKLKHQWVILSVFCEAIVVSIIFIHGRGQLFR